MHVFHGALTDLRYLDELIDLYIGPYASAIGTDFSLMDNNALSY